MLAPVVFAAVALCPQASPVHRSLLADGYVRVPLGVTRKSEMFVVPCRAGGHDLRLGLDTGAAPYAALTPAAAKRLGQKVRPVPDDPQDPNTGVTFLPELTVGGVVTRGGTAVVRSLPADLDELLDGLIGHACLEYYDAHIDYPSLSLFLRPPGDADLSRLIGDWECVGMHANGVSEPPTFDVRRLKMTWTRAYLGDGDRVSEMILEVNDRRTPPWLFLWKPIQEDGVDLRPGVGGIYKLAGDHLIIRLPTGKGIRVGLRDFVPAPGNIILRYKRVGRP